MKLNELKNRVIKAQQLLKAAELKALVTRQKAKIAKGKALQAKSEFKRARKSAKEAKRLAIQAEDELREQLRVVAKTEKRLAKGLRKLPPQKHRSQTKPSAKKTAVRVRRHAVRKPVVARKPAHAPQKPQFPLPDSEAIPMALTPPPPPPPISPSL